MCTAVLHWSNTAYPHARIKKRVRVLCVAHQTHTKGQTGKTDQIIIVKNWKRASNPVPRGCLKCTASCCCWSLLVTTKKKAKLLFIALYSSSIWCLQCSLHTGVWWSALTSISHARKRETQPHILKRYLSTLEISCSEALKYLGKKHIRLRGSSRSPNNVSWTLTPHRKPQDGTNEWLWHTGRWFRDPFPMVHIQRGSQGLFLFYSKRKFFKDSLSSTWAS